MKYLILIGLMPFAVWAGANTSDWENSLKGIASGEQAWLAKVPQLAATADVQQATRMEDALASALAKNTRACWRRSGLLTPDPGPIWQVQTLSAAFRLSNLQPL